MGKSIKQILVLLFLTVLFLQNGNAVTKTSAATGNWNTAATWSPSGVPSAGDDVIISSGHVVTVDVNTGNLTSLTINLGGTLSSSGNKTVSATTITVNGLYLNGSTGTITGTMTVNSGGVYQHNINGGTVKSATWNTGSTCLVSGVVGTLPSGFTQNFYNLTWSSANTSPYTIAPTAINGDFTVTAGGTGTNYLAISTASFTIAGNLYILGSANLQIATSTSRSLTVTKDFSMTAGSLTMSSGSGTGTMNVKGNFTHTGGTITETSTGNGAFIFNGGTTQTYTSGGTVSNTINFTVNSGTTLQMKDGTTVVTGAAFTLSSGATIGITSADGITTAGNLTGNIRTTTRTFNAAANYIYNGTTAQVTGSALTTTANLTINNSLGVTASSDLTVNGILNLQSANPLATKGALEMSSFTLTMGASATTIGTGDVTGIVKRTSFAVNTPYSFGNQFTTIDLASGGTLPTWISVKIILTSSHIWKTDAVHRYYDISQATGTSATKATLNLHYLSTELNGATEGDMDLFDYHVSTTTLHDHGRSNDNITNKWVGLANISITYIAPSTSSGSKYWGLGTSITGNDHIWSGAANSTVWDDAGNWTGGIPDIAAHVTIPAGLTYFPVLPVSTTIGTLSINQGGTLNATTGTPTLTITGGAGAWDNMGTFTPGTSTIIFSNSSATMSDPTNFYNVTISDGATLTLGTDNLMRIAGSLSLSSTGILNAANNNNTIEYNGTGNQTVILPNGSGTGYYNLILSGGGTKTLPSALMNIYGNFTLSGTVIATAQNEINVSGNFDVGSGTSFTAGAYSHTVGGNFTKTGTFTSTGSTYTLNGYTVQTISGSPAFNNLIISSYNKSILAGNTTIAGDLTITSGGTLDLSTYTCNRTTSGGRFTNAGKLKLGNNSGGQTGSNFPLNFVTVTLTGGTVEYYGSGQTIYTGVTNYNLIISGSNTVTMPSGDITINDFELNNASGVSLAGNLTVNGVLNLNNGLLTLGSKNIILGVSATVTGSPSGSNMVVATGTGEFRKVFTGTGSFEFPVGSFGSNLDYSPVILNFTSGTFASAYVGLNLSQLKHPNNSSSTSYLTRYWSISQSGISNFSCGVTLQYVVADIVGNEYDIWCGKYSGGVWTLLSQANLDANQLSGTVTSFSTFTGGEQGVLPVNLNSFNSSVSGRDIKLNWVTAAEHNNEGFEIERVKSSELRVQSWEKIGYVKGMGTVNTQTNYTFTDSKLNTGKYQYRLKQIDHNGNFTYFNLNAEVEVGLPGKYNLSQNYPNPFNPVTKIDFDLPLNSKVNMVIYDVSGREVKTLLNDERAAGFYTTMFDASSLSSGVYFYRLTAKSSEKDFVSFKKMVLIK